MADSSKSRVVSRSSFESGVDHDIVESLAGNFQQLVDGFIGDIRGGAIGLGAASTNKPELCDSSKPERNMASRRLKF